MKRRVGRPRRVPRGTAALGDQVAALLTERAQLVSRTAAIDQTLAAVRKALGVTVPHKSTEVARPGADEPDRNRLAMRDTAAELAHPNRDQARTDTILAALEDGALSVRDIAEELHQDRLIVKQALQRLAKAGVLMKIGQGNGTKYTKHTERPAPAAPRAVAQSDPTPILRAHTVSKTDLSSVEARDLAVLHHLRVHIATLEQIIAALPEEPGLSEDQFAAACQASVTRLGAKGLIVRSGRAWTAAAGSRAVHG